MKKLPPLPLVVSDQVAPLRLTDAQFDALAEISRLRIGSDKYLAAYQHFVNGAEIAEAARLTVVKYSTAWDAVKAAKRNIELCKKVAYPS